MRLKNELWLQTSAYLENHEKWDKVINYKNIWMLRSEIGRGEIKSVRIVTVIPSLIGVNELKKNF